MTNSPPPEYRGEGSNAVGATTPCGPGAPADYQKRSFHQSYLLAVRLYHQ
jgi:hypothetical protein